MALTFYTSVHLNQKTAHEKAPAAQTGQNIYSGQDQAA